MRYNAHCKDYYERKLKEGKNKFTIFNAMKNKLVRLICSLAKQGKKYSDRRCGRKLYVFACLNHRNPVRRLQSLWYILPYFTIILVVFVPSVTLFQPTDGTFFPKNAAHR